MIENLSLFLIGYLAAVFQSSAGMFFQVGLIRIDAIPAIICWYSLRKGAPEGVVALALFGLLISGFSTIASYCFPLSYLLGYFTIRYIVANVLEFSRLQVYLMTGFISMEIIVMQLAASGNPELVWPWGLLQALVNVITAPIFMALCSGFASGFRRLKGHKTEVRSE